jgi:hypothetical protein
MSEINPLREWVVKELGSIKSQLNIKVQTIERLEKLTQMTDKEFGQQIGYLANGLTWLSPNLHLVYLAQYGKQIELGDSK